MIKIYINLVNEKRENSSRWSHSELTYWGLICESSINTSFPMNRKKIAELNMNSRTASICSCSCFLSFFPCFFRTEIFSWLFLWRCNTIMISNCILYWTPGLGRKGPVNKGLSVLSDLPSVRKFSWDWLISFFLKLSMVLGAVYSCVWQSRIFWEKSPSGKNDQKWSKMAPKRCFWTLRN